MDEEDNKKLFNISAHFELEPTIKAVEEGEDEVLRVTGYASTKHLDRHNDVVESAAWEKGLEDYSRNPIILAFHRHDMPIGKAVDMKLNSKGLKITAEISKAAGNVYDLVKEGILSTFSVGFAAKKMEYNEKDEHWVIKEAELYEISVVSVPANSHASFSVMKGFDSEEDYETFKKQFTENIPKKEENTLMDDDNKSPAAPAVVVDYAKIARDVAKTLKDQRDAEKAEELKIAEKEAVRKEEIRIEAKSIADTLVAEITKDFAESTGALKAELAKAAADNKEELAAYYRAQGNTKGGFIDSRAPEGGITRDEKDACIILSKAFGKPIDQSDYFKSLTEKDVGDHLTAGMEAWETDFNSRIHQEMKKQLKVEDKFQSMPMNAATMTLPYNPQTTAKAQWIPVGNFGSLEGSPPTTAASSSTGAAAAHQVKQWTISSFKLAAKEYIGYEEEEDAIIAVMPLIRQSISDRMATASDLAILLGSDTGTVPADYDPISGLAKLAGDFGLTVALGSTTAYAGLWTYEKFLEGRQALGRYGYNPSDLTLFVNEDLYYTMLSAGTTPNGQDWNRFQTMDKVGNEATLLSGQIGSIGGTAVILTEAFTGATTAGTSAAVLCRTSNFIQGNLRNMLTENAVDIEDQRRTIVSTRRFGFRELDESKGVVSFNVAA